MQKRIERTDQKPGIEQTAGDNQQYGDESHQRKSPKCTAQQLDSEPGVTDIMDGME